MTEIEQAEFWDLGSGVTCIDTGYIKPGLAACYLLSHGDEAAIIETGTSFSVARILAVLRQQGVEPPQVRYVIPTHVHLDHAGGAGALMAALPNATAVVHPRGARHLINPEKLIAGSLAVYGEERFRRLYGEIVPIPEQRVAVAEDGATLSLAGRELLFRDTPGHANHHFCVWDQQSRGWFSGDTFGLSYRELAFPAGRFLLPTTTPVQFDPDRLLHSIDLLVSYRPARMYLTHFGLLENPQRYVDMLKNQIVEYREMALAGQGQADRVAYFTRRLAELSLDRLRNLDPHLQWQDVELLDMDMELNAQGLDVWLQRQETQD